MESHPESRVYEGHLRGKVTREHRELMVLRWLCEQFAGRFDHLEALTERRIASVSRLVRDLRGAGYVETRKILVGERMWVIPTSKGMKKCGLSYRSALVGTMSLAHIGAINDVRLHIQRRSPEDRWISERELAAGSPPAGHLPDGVVIHEGLRVAIEVELSRKTPRVLKAKLNELEVRFDLVVFFCAPGPYRHLSALIEKGEWPKAEVRELPRPPGG